MTMKYTPGPWTLETVRTSIGICHKVGPFPGKRDDDKPRHACLYADHPSPGNPNDEELEANAHLIVAAPALLAYYRASRNLQMTLGHPDATAQDENEAEAAYDAASSAAADAVGALGAA